MTGPAAGRRGLPSRVLMTADAVGGVWTYALDLARGLSEAGIEVSLAVLGPAPHPDQAQDVRSIPGVTLIETGLPLDWTAADMETIDTAGAEIRKLARRLQVDLVHLNSPALAAGGGFDAPVVGACHSCLATWWAAVRDGEMPEDFRWRTQALWRGLIACDTLIAPTAAFARATARAYDVPVPFVVRNGRQAATIAATKREPSVLTAGRLWDTGKNVAALDAAAAYLDGWVFAAGPLEGPGGERTVLRHAMPLGRLPAEAVRGWMARAPIFVSTALYEPFGLSVLEAAQAGCALVLSDIPTFRELWDGAAVFVPPEDHQALAAALRSLLAARAATARLGVRAKTRAGLYTCQAMSEGVLGVYRSVLAAPRHEAVA